MLVIVKGLDLGIPILWYRRLVTHLSPTCPSHLDSCKYVWGPRVDNGRKSAEKKINVIVERCEIP